MRVVIQRVTKASVVIKEQIVGEIERGILIFFASHKDDVISSVSPLVQRIANLRIFPDEKGKMNLSLKELGFSALVVSQFTLYGDCSVGRRPSFSDAATPEKAKEIYHLFIEELKKEISNVQQGIFGAKMQVHLINDGPVTLILDTK